MGNILIGLSSWSDPSLAHSGFYPSELKTPGERLFHYSRNFPLAEMDSSYHFLPGLHNLSIWLEATPKGFLFDVKAFSLLTGHPTAVDSFPGDLRQEISNIAGDSRNVYIHKLPETFQELVWERFVRAINPISAAGKLGLLIFQFPSWFHPVQENYDYILLCKKKLDGYRVAVEFRVGDWLNGVRREYTLEFLKKNELCLLCVDEPQGLKSSVPPVAEVTSRIAAVRFHGRNKKNWEGKAVKGEDKFNYLYTEEELNEWVPRIRLMAEQAEAVHVVFKTKPAALAAQNALQMQNILT